MVKFTEEFWAEKRAIQQPLVTAITSKGTNDYDPTDWSTIPLHTITPTRADLAVLQQLRAQGPSTSPARIWTVINEFEGTADTASADSRLSWDQRKQIAATIRATIRKEEGNALFKDGAYDAAIAKYREAMGFILLRIKPDIPLVLPAPTYFYPKYLYIGENCEDRQGTQLEYLDLLALGGNIAQCYSKQGDHVQTIDWIQEILQMFMSQRHTILKDKPSWKDSDLPLLEYWVFRAKTQLRGYNEFSALGNTSLAAHYGQGAWTSCVAPGMNKYPKLTALRKEMDYSTMFRLRHPEPNLIDKTHLTCPEIQVHGTWEKLPSITQGLRPIGRCAHSSWVWKGRLYICHGVGDGFQQEVKDMWYLDLETHIWTRLPDVPTLRPVAGLSATRPMRVWNDKVYLFVGTRTLHVFDLVSEEWSLLATTLQSGTSWPYSAESPLEAFNTAILDDKLYVFGGDDGKNPLGHNIFVVLDLSTNRWEHISGTSTHRPQSFEPNLRSLSSMWAAPRQRKIYILYGSANRTKARHRSAPGGGEDDYTYDDFWSYHVDDKKWERERLRGNYPSPRTEAASVFADASGRAVVYGGYHGSLPTLETTPGHQKQSYTFSFFGDTFVYNPDANIWQHVLVRGFPSYRAMSTFANDPDTGKIYLSGGYSNSDFVPAKNVATRVYHDVWTLKLDLPGGHWNPQDLTRDLRAEKMGPWMRCFTCGNCGITWQKCSGACGGKYYFCSKECQRSGWKEHKEKTIAAESCRMVGCGGVFDRVI